MDTWTWPPQVAMILALAMLIVMLLLDRYFRTRN